MKRASTRSISIDVPPQVVLDLVADPTELPRWAPAFARAVRPAGGDHWVVDTGEREVRIRVRVSRELGTVDFLAAGTPRGAYGRVVPNGEGSEFLFTVFLPEDAGAAARDRQGAVLDSELATVRALCEAAAAQ